MKIKFTNAISIFSLILLFLSCSSGHSYADIVGRKMVVPECLQDSTDYIFLYVIRNQDCTECSVGTLYQWENLISMVGRMDISFCFIVETRPNDVAESIEQALSRKPFSRPLFIDYSHEFLNNNSWLMRRKNLGINGFLLDKSMTIVMVGDPMEEFQFILKMNQL